MIRPKEKKCWQPGVPQLLTNKRLMTEGLHRYLAKIYDSCGLQVKGFGLETESRDYHACRFMLGDRSILYRKAKITPKKTGQFVTCWKRGQGGPIEPYHAKDSLDFLIIEVQRGEKLGQFVFPKSGLIRRGIVSTDTKEGKRGFRVYPIWDDPQSKQARQTQRWQLTCFVEFGNGGEGKHLRKLL